MINLDYEHLTSRVLYNHDLLVRDRSARGSPIANATWEWLSSLVLIIIVVQSSFKSLICHVPVIEDEL